MKNTFTSFSNNFTFNNNNNDDIRNVCHLVTLVREQYLHDTFYWVLLGQHASAWIASVMGHWKRMIKILGDTDYYDCIILKYGMLLFLCHITVYLILDMEWRTLDYNLNCVIFCYFNKNRNDNSWHIKFLLIRITTT